MPILLYLLTNLLVVLTISLVLSRLTAAGLLPPELPLLQLLGPGAQLTAAGDSGCLAAR
jgi:hypothetical protein